MYRIYILVITLFFLLACNRTNEVLETDDSTKNDASRWYSVAQVSQGKQVYQNNCASCHGDQAQGLTKDWRKTLPDGSYPPPPLNGTAHAWHHPLPQLIRTIERGGVPLGGVMPGFADKLHESEKQSVIAFFQSFWSDDIYQLWLERGGLSND